jgi:aminoglycoside phosphotransferase (APT) family kinase protein
MPETDFEPKKLEAWLAHNVERARGEMQLQRISGGQSNPTYFVSFLERKLVLRKQPIGDLLPSAHAVDREFRILRALATTPVPVPNAVIFCDDRNVIGTPFYVMDRLDGRILANYALPEIPAAQKGHFFNQFAEILAKLHGVDWRATGLSDYGKPGNYFARQIARWARQWQASKQEENADVERLIAWLPNNIPEGDATTIVHGDFRFGNMMFHPTAPEIIGVLDWELSTLGHPLADVAFAAMAWELPPTVFDGLRGLDLDTLGIPSQREFLDVYQQHCGAKFGEIKPFHLAFSMFRFAVILEGVRARAALGNASSGNAAEVGAQAKAFARRAVELIDS